ncbi:MAG: hypothetical protein NUW37_09280 [Planctomycetes bacterium]|nr:hypothetical protein [Planctomycetota bacterium]
MNEYIKKTSVRLKLAPAFALLALSSLYFVYIISIGSETREFETLIRVNSSDMPIENYDRSKNQREPLPNENEIREVEYAAAPASDESVSTIGIEYPELSQANVVHHPKIWQLEDWEEVGDRLIITRHYYGPRWMTLTYYAPNDVVAQKSYWSNILMAALIKAKDDYFDPLDTDALIAVEKYSEIAKKTDVEFLLSNFVNDGFRKIGLTFSIAKAIEILSREFAHFSFDQLDQYAETDPLPPVQYSIMEALKYVPSFSYDEKIRWRSWVDRVDNSRWINDRKILEKYIYLLIDSAIVSCGQSLVPDLCSLFRESILSKGSPGNQEQSRRHSVLYSHLIVDGVLIENFWNSEQFQNELVAILSDPKYKYAHLTIIAELSDPTYEISGNDIERLGINGIAYQLAINKDEIADYPSLLRLMRYFTRFGRLSEIWILEEYKDRFPDYIELIEETIGAIKNRS